MMEDDGESVIPSGEASREFAASFTDFVSRVVIHPFGGRLFQPVHDLATELDLPESLFSALKEEAQVQGASLRRNQRKPRTPSKIMKTNIGTPAVSIQSTSAKKKFETKEI